MRYFVLIQLPNPLIYVTQIVQSVLFCSKVMLNTYKYFHSLSLCDKDAAFFLLYDSDSHLSVLPWLHGAAGHEPQHRTVAISY